jgi:hypothetical protein
MSAIEMKVREGPNPTSVSVWIRNSSSGSITVAAPNPYRSIWVYGNNREPFSAVRATAWQESRKACQLGPKEELLVTIDLEPYWDEVLGSVTVKVSLQATDSAGTVRECIAEGEVFLNIPSFDEKITAMKKRPRPNLPLRLLDVSDSTQFERVNVK